MSTEHIRARLRAHGVPFGANDNIADALGPGELELIESEVRRAAHQLLKALVIDIEGDHNTRETADRVARMYVREVFRGRYERRPPLTEFPNAKQLDELYTVGPVTVRSACSHHLVPIVGEAWVGVIPGEQIIGLSKFTRLVEWVLSRPQIQEEAVVQLADELERVVQPRGLAVIIKANHFCMAWRGVRDRDTSMTTSVMRGRFRDSQPTREEFLTLIQGQGFRP